MTKVVPIDKGIPIPIQRKSTGSRGHRYPWAEMEIGDSFLAPVMPDQNPLNTQANLYTMAKSQGIKIATRAQQEGIRVWRIK